MNEIYKDITGYEGLYQISNFGNVKSLPKGDGNGYKTRLLKFDIKETVTTSYARVTLSKEGKTKRYQVHRLVAEAFLANPENKPFINHIDNNGENNNVNNLEWCTHSENMIHAQKQGRLFNSQSKGQKAGAKTKRLKAEADAIDNYYNKVFGYLLVLEEHHLKSTPTAKRLMLHCKCIRDGCTYQKPIYKERHQLTSSNKILQCPSCACKHGNTGNNKGNKCQT